MFHYILSYVTVVQYFIIKLEFFLFVYLEKNNSSFSNLLITNDKLISIDFQFTNSVKSLAIEINLFQERV